MIRVERNYDYGKDTAQVIHVHKTVGLIMQFEIRI